MFFKSIWEEDAEQLMWHGQLKLASYLGGN